MVSAEDADDLLFSEIDVLSLELLENQSDHLSLIFKQVTKYC